MAGYAVNGVRWFIPVKNLRSLISGFLGFLLAACSAQSTATEISFPPSTVPTNTNQLEVTQVITTSAMSSQAISCEAWQSWPVIPSVSETARRLYQQGQAAGNNPRAFSKIGDGEISTEWFLTMFDLGESYYDLGPHQELRSVIEHFAGSFGRIGMAAKRGFNTKRILDSTMSDPAVCAASESPLACELRLHKSAFVILSLGTNQVWQPDEFEQGMRQILDFLLVNN